MQRYSAEEHFERLDETTDLIRDRLERCEESVDHPAMLTRDPVWTRRVHKNQSQFLRSLIVRNVIEMVYETLDWQNFASVLSGVELFNISTYQSDFVFDLHSSEHKGDFLDSWRSMSVRQFAASYTTYTMALDELKEARIHPDLKSVFVEKMILAGRRVYEGQYMDAFVLRQSDTTHPLSHSEEAFLDDYIERCRKLDGYQFAMCFYCGLVSEDQMDARAYQQIGALLWEAGMHFGICIQILNDMEDLLPLNEDAYQDVKDEKITYPIYLLWNHSEKAKAVLRSCWRTENRQDGACDELRHAIRSNGEILEPLLKLLMHHYKKISASIKVLKSNGVRATQYLDFIFPHLFLSRIVKGYAGPDKNPNNLIDALR